MAVEYARVERCGRVALGEYCLHLHLVGDCPSCAMPITSASPLQKPIITGTGIMLTSCAAPARPAAS